MKKSDRRLANRYLNLLEAALVGTLYGDPPNDTWSGKQYDARARALGHDWPSPAQTMIGTMRMRNLRHLCEEAHFQRDTRRLCRDRRVARRRVHLHARHPQRLW